MDTLVELCGQLACAAIFLAIAALGATAAVLIIALTIDLVRSILRKK